MSQLLNNNCVRLCLFYFLLLFPNLSFITVDSLDLSGTVWRYYGNGQYDTYLIKFLEGGGIEMEHPLDVTPFNDGWQQKGRKLLFWYNDHYSDYQGKIMNTSLIQGKSKNRKGNSWEFELRRESAGKPSKNTELTSALNSKLLPLLFGI